MKTVCEYVSKEILPGLRALIAKKMMADHGLSQTAVAKVMGTTQPAVSQYKRELRGKIAALRDDPFIVKKIDEITRRMVRGDLSPMDAGMEFCQICREMQRKGMIPEEYASFKNE